MTILFGFVADAGGEHGTSYTLSKLSTLSDTYRPWQQFRKVQEKIQ